jgi:hypothetical protein
MMRSLRLIQIIQMRSSSRTRLLLAIMACCLCGCANSPFYNETRDKQGQALVKAADQIDLVATVDELDKKFAGLRQREIEALKGRQAANRTLEIAQVASPGPGGNGTVATRYVSLIDARLERLTGAIASGRALERAANNDSQTVRQQTFLRSFSAMSQVNVTSCAAAVQLSDGQGSLKQEAQGRIPSSRLASSKALFTQVMQHCANKAAPLFDVSGRNELLGQYRAMLGDARLRGRTFADEVALKKKELETLTAAYEAEVKATTPKDGDSTASARLATAAAKLQKAVQALQKADASGAFGHALAEEEVKSLETVLSALASGESDLTKLDSTQRRAVALVSALPSLTDEADKLLKEAARPRLGPLLLAKEQQRLAVEGFTGKQAILQEEVNLREQQVAAAEDEATALTRARLVLTQDGLGPKVNLDQSMSSALADTSEGGRRKAALFESLAYYFDEAQAARSKHETLELSVNGLSDEVVMQQSRSAARMWNSLLKNIAAVLAEHHAAGIKTADLAEFFKGFGLVVIGTQAGK